MKKYFKLLMVALFATLSFSLVSCGDDDDDDNGALVGTWEASYSDPTQDYAVYAVLTFTKDGHFSLSETDYENGRTDYFAVNGTYILDGNPKEGATVYMEGINNDGDEVDAKIIVKVDGNTLYTTDMEDGDTRILTRK